jgi:aminocarboxymuconate-semialdehyde decarboxylase
MIIDMHTHFVSRNYIDLAERDPESAGAMLVRDETGALSLEPIGSQLPLGRAPLLPGIYDIEAKIRAMDALAVGVSAIAPPTFMFYYWAQPEAAIRIARIQNDGLAAVCQAYPERLVGLATVPLQAPELAVAELDRAIGELGLRGVEIGTSVNGLDLDHAVLLPFFERVQALNVPVFVHPNACAIAGGRASKYYFQNAIGFLLDTTLAIGSLIFGGVLERLPDLKLYFGHGGGFVPYQIGRLDHVGRVRPECAGLLPRLPSDYLRHLYFDSLTHSDQALAYLVSLVGSDHVVLGTDHPFDMGDYQAVDSVRSMAGLTGADRDAILGGNAARLLQIPTQREPGTVGSATMTE